MTESVLEISAQLGDAAVNKYVEDHVVCPPGLRRGLFTTTAMDNIDHKTVLYGADRIDRTSFLLLSKNFVRSGSP